MPRTVVLLVLLATVLSVVPPAPAQNISTTMQQVYRTYSTRDGLPQATIQSLEGDQRGWLWAATQSGVAYNNGRRWQTLPALNRAMRTAFWQGRRILADHNSDMWFGTQGDGIYHLHTQPGAPPEMWDWTHYTHSDGLSSDTVLALHETTDGIIWAGTARGLSTFRDSAWTAVDLPDSLADAQFYAIHEDNQGHFLFGTDLGLIAYDGSVWSEPLLPGMLKHRDVYALHEDRTGTIWAALRGGIAKRMDGTWHAVREEVLDPQQRQNENYVAIAEQADGTIGFAQRTGGLLRLHRDGSWDVLDERNGLPSRLTNTLHLHPDGSYWIGTASGLAVLRNDTWHVISEDIETATASLWAIAEMQDGAIWFGASRFISVYDNGRWQILRGPDGTPLPYTLSIHQAQDGQVWVGTKRGLFTYNQGQWSVIERNIYVYDIIERADGSLLFGSQDGIWQYAQGAFTRFAPDQPLLTGTIRTLEKLDDGTLWFGVAEKGVLRYDGQSWQLLSTQDGLPTNSVLDVYKDIHGLLWFATTKGLVLYDGTTFRIFTDQTQVALPDFFTYRIEQDYGGRYYVSTNLGIARLTLDAAQQTSAHRLPVDSLQFKVEHFGLADGLPELEANQGASLRDSQGRIWFGLIAGAAMMDPGTNASEDPLPITIEHIEIADLADSTFAEQLQKARGPLGLSHTQHDLTFTYTLGAPGNPEQVRYQTQLIGYDAQPSAWTEATTRSYTNLSPGTYTFTVIGREGIGPVSTEARFSFHIARPPWATWWAYAIYFLLAGLVVAALLHWQTERVRRRDAQYVAIEKERLSRKVAEAQTRLLHSENLRLAEMNQANEFQQRVMDGTTEAIFALDLKGHLTLFNVRLEDLTGYEKTQLRDHTFTALFTRRAAQQIQRALDTVLRDKATVRALEVQLALEEQPYLSLTFSPLMQGEKVTGIIGLAKDITEQRHLEQFRDDMLRMLVHDLRNPLSVVMMISRELQENPNMASEIRSELSMMAFRNSEQALSLVNKLLDVSRLEAQKMPLECTSVAPKEVIHRVADAMRPLFDEREITFLTDFPAHLPDVYADSSLLQRVLQNLLNNATRHTPQHGTITLSLSTTSNNLTLRITDSGPGIDPALQPHLFEKYASGTNGSGVGLGLAFCRLAVEAMDGKIWLDESVSEGASFVFTLPTAPTVTTTSMRQPQQVS